MGLRNIDFSEVSPARRSGAPAVADSEVSPACRQGAPAVAADGNKDKAYVEGDIADEYSQARAIGVRLAPGAKPQKAEPVIQTRRQPAPIPVAANGDVDYRDLDRPAFQRRNKESAGTSVSSALVTEPIHALPDFGRQSGVRINMSDTLSDFISKMKMTPNEKLGCVDFRMPDESKVAFRRFPDAITVGDRTPDDSIILAMLELGKSDFGAIEVYGSPEFIAAAVRVARENNIVLQNREYTQALSGSRARTTMRG